jgi:predicted ATPase/DNA-binding CsgD family transcriptional regulator/tetratricopeptide (TPR) repeat protein
MADPTPFDRSRIQPVPSSRRAARDGSGPRLPAPLTSFVGRERVVATLIDMLLRADVRLLTLTGPGGVGKTRLALQVASALAARFPDGVGFVGLAPLATPDLVVPAVAQVLGVRDSGREPLTERIIAFLGDKHLLLVFDNFEHLIEAAPFVTDVLASCPGVTALVTSRARLHLSGEFEHVISPLALAGSGDVTGADAAVPEAVRLFVERTRAVREDFVLTPENVATVAAICRRLDGLPLAIELAAARGKVLPPAALLARLATRLRLLTDGGRDLPARQRTMRATIAWSYDLLSPEEQVLFRRLGVFVGGCTLEAAEWVSGRDGRRDAGGGRMTDIHRPSTSSPLHPITASPSALDLVSSLVDKSLLQVNDGPGGEPRYALLETVREFALERLAESGEETTIRVNHAAWFLAVAEQTEIATWGGPEHAHWLDQIEAELSNLRGALGWLEENGEIEATLRLAGSLVGLWFHRSHRTEGHAWLQRALARADEVPTVGRAKALVALTKLGMFLGSDEAAAHAAESVAVWTELGDAWRAADARLALGMVLHYQDDYERAAPLLEEVAAELDALGEPLRAAIARLNLGVAALEHGDGTRAEALLEDVLALFHRGGYQWAVPTTLLSLGQAAVNRGDAAAAAAYYAESLALAGNQEDLVSALVKTANLAAGRRALVATRLFGAAAALAETVGYPLRPVEQVRCQDAAAGARAALGDATFEAAWAAGQTLTAEQAVAEAAAMLDAMRAPAAPGAAAGNAFGLTPRERQVLRLLAEGHSNQVIADALFVSPRTVKNHVASILAKLGVGSRAAAVAHALRQGLA